MPTYDYKCQDCGHTFEKFQSIRARKLSKCPRCGGKLKRLVGTGAGIIVKGSGFYETDYRSPEYKKAEKKEKESLKPSPKKDSAKKSGSPAKKKSGDSSGPSKKSD